MRPLGRSQPAIRSAIARSASTSRPCSWSSGFEREGRLVRIGGAARAVQDRRPAARRRACAGRWAGTGRRRAATPPRRRARPRTASPRPRAGRGRARSRSGGPRPRTSGRSPARPAGAPRPRTGRRSRPTRSPRRSPPSGPSARGPGRPSGGCRELVAAADPVQRRALGRRAAGRVRGGDRSSGSSLTPWYEPAIREIDSSISVPPRSLTPQRSASVAASSPIFTQLACRFGIVRPSASRNTAVCLRFSSRVISSMPCGRPSWVWKGMKDSGTNSVKPPVRSCSARTTRMCSASSAGVSMWPNITVTVERRPAPWAASTISTQRAAGQLVRADALRGRRRRAPRRRCPGTESSPASARRANTSAGGSALGVAMWRSPSASTRAGAAAARSPWRAAASRV